MIKACFRASSVDDSLGLIKEVSLIQVGAAKGHGVFIDETSLETAISVLGQTLPAYITHENALGDRLLNEVGYFQGFRIEEKKLKAQKFVALESFKRDDSKQYERLFDIASTIPENFGISLVFNAQLVWVLEGGKEVKAEAGEQAPTNSVYELPSVRFSEIHSADFVDTPAANADGLFSNTTKPTITMDETPVNEATPKVEAVEEIEQIASEVEETEQQEALSADSETPTEVQADSNDERINELDKKFDAILEKLGAITDKTEKLEAINQVTRGVEPQPVSQEESKPDIVTQFKSAQGRDISKLWKTHKSELFNQLNSH